MLQVPVLARSSKRKIHAPRGKRNVNTNKKITMINPLLHINAF
jgi:hypothetical protein